MKLLDKRPLKDGVTEGYVVLALCTAIEECGGEAPLDMIYRTVKGRVSLDTFEAVVKDLEKAGLIYMHGRNVRGKQGGWS